MLQLEQRFYSRKEIAEVLGVNINDSNHFARNVKDSDKPASLFWSIIETTQISYKGKEHELPMSALGTKLFFTRKGASCPKNILKEREATERDNNAFRVFSVLHRLAESDCEVDWDELMSPPEYE